jgi:DtxR family Mn-dependent transcriptional regulator
MREKERKSEENYLGSILSIQKKKGVCFSVDVANDLHFTKASVSIAMKKMIEEGYVQFGDNHELILLPSGKKIANNILHKRRILEEALTGIGVSAKNAAEDAHKIEHDISTETLDCLIDYITRKNLAKE